MGKGQSKEPKPTEDELDDEQIEELVRDTATELKQHQLPTSSSISQQLPSPPPPPPPLEPFHSVPSSNPVPSFSSQWKRNPAFEQFLFDHMPVTTPEEITRKNLWEWEHLCNQEKIIIPNAILKTLRPTKNNNNDNKDSSPEEKQQGPLSPSYFESKQPKTIPPSSSAPSSQRPPSQQNQQNSIPPPIRTVVVPSQQHRSISHPSPSLSSSSSFQMSAPIAKVSQPVPQQPPQPSFQVFIEERQPLKSRPPQHQNQHTASFAPVAALSPPPPPYPPPHHHQLSQTKSSSAPFPLTSSSIPFENSSSSSLSSSLTRYKSSLSTLLEHEKHLAQKWNIQQRIENGNLPKNWTQSDIDEWTKLRERTRNQHSNLRAHYINQVQTMQLDLQQRQNWVKDAQSALDQDCLNYHQQRCAALQSDIDKLTKILNNSGNGDGGKNSMQSTSYEF